MRFKGKKRIVSYRDTFSLDMMLSPVIHAGLVKFSSVLREKESQGGCYGVPCDFYNEETKQTNQKLWFDTIDKMAYAFGDYDDDFELQYSEGHQAKVTEGLELFGKYYNSLWW